jgi:AcrR family transcriptional regulator
MVYYYFPTKDDLFMAVVEEVYTGFVADLSTALTADGGIEHRIEQVYERIGAISDDELEVIRVLIRELLLASPRAKLALERFRAGHIPLVLSALGEGVRDGVVDGSRSPVVLLLSTFALGALPQLLIRVMGDSAPLSEAPQGEALARELASVLMRGIGTPRAPP